MTVKSILAPRLGSADDPSFGAVIELDGIRFQSSPPETMEEYDKINKVIDELIIDPHNSV